MKLKASTTISILYSVITFGIAVYWANNYKEFVKYKGDEFFFFLYIMLGFTYLFLLILRFTDKKINLFLLLLFPVGVAVVSFFMGFIFYGISGIGDTPGKSTYIYWTIYIVITLILISFKKLKKVPKNRKD
ncbi:MAG: hypothetical protein ACSLE0_17180 [Chitinophagaceae bacterium]